jgi:flagellar biosynthesis regulator FlaF
MLDQVDFLVETIGDESLQLSDEMRSNLLQFLLTIANLNEEIRHKAALGL